MSDQVKLRLQPLGQELHVARHTPLRDILFAHGVEFPCAGRQHCKRCRVRLVAGELPVADAAHYGLTPAELADGIRLACAHRIAGDLVLEVVQWEAKILADESQFAFTPQDGVGIAIDLGTTTIAGQLVDLRTGQVLGVRTGLNRQAQHGADIMSRISFALAGGQRELETTVRTQLGELSLALAQHVPAGSALTQVIVVGNTPMHNLFCGIDVTPLAHYPFAPADDSLRVFPAADLGWALPGNPPVHFLPGLGSFVGSDILAGLIATRVHELPGLNVFVDLGTNGEIVVCQGGRLRCASTAAGPAFEAATISQGMQATTGAISEVEAVHGQLRCSVLGGVKPRGICGSGLVDAVAAFLDLGLVNATGRIVGGAPALEVHPPVQLTARDIRELQLAKGATAVGVRLLVEQLGGTLADVDRLLVAGAFGNYIRLASACRLGLFQTPVDRIKTVGNTALLGAKVALFNGGHVARVYADILGRITHVSLNTDPKFQDYYVDALLFP